MARRRVAVAGGGTAGHILTAFDILAAYRNEFGCDGIYIGSETGLGSRLIAGNCEPMELIPAKPWARQSWFGKTRGAASLLPAFLAARRILIRERTEVVIGTGGYASAAPCLAGRALGLRVVIHEANAVPGLANRYLARIADLICADSQETARHFASGRAAVTGTPCNPIAPGVPRTQAPFHLIILGGSEGSPWLNRRAPELMGELQRRSVDFSVHHLTGMEDPAATRAAYASAGVSARVEGWVTDMGPVYGAATFAIAHPGARTLAELSSGGIPALLSPLPGVAHGHHRNNARLYCEQTGAWFVSERAWNPRELAARIQSLLQDPEALRGMSARARSYAHSGAACAIARETESMFRE